MSTEKSEQEIIDNAIRRWQRQGLIDEATARKLQDSPAPGNSSVLSTYALIACVSCGLLAFGALVMDEKWIELMRRQFQFSEITVGIFFLGLTVLLSWISYRRRKKMPEAGSTREAFHITIVLSLAVALAYTGRSIGYQNGNYAPILLLAAAIYGVIAVVLSSRFLWAVMLLALAGWWGAQTYYWSQGSDYFLGMNYALRMTVFGIAVLLLQIPIQRSHRLQPYRQLTQVMGWLFFLVATLSLSVLGNSSSIEVWMDIKQGRLWYWAVAFTLMLIGLIVYSFRKKDAFLRDASLIFFLVNIYTRYFEYFWDKTNKGIFFALLAISFWWLGRTAERWRRKNIAEATTTPEERL